MILKTQLPWKSNKISKGIKFHSNGDLTMKAKDTSPMTGQNNYVGKNKQRQEFNLHFGTPEVHHIFHLYNQFYKSISSSKMVLYFNINSGLGTLCDLKHTPCFFVVSTSNWISSESWTRGQHIDVTIHSFCTRMTYKHASGSVGLCNDGVTLPPYRGWENQRLIASSSSAHPSYLSHWPPQGSVLAQIEADILQIWKQQITHFYWA